MEFFHRQSLLAFWATLEFIVHDRPVFQENCLAVRRRWHLTHLTSHRSIFGLQPSNADGPARKIGNLNLLVSDVVEFQNDRIAFAAVDVRMRLQVVDYV
jgi:hypothetical protein